MSLGLMNVAYLSEAQVNIVSLCRQSPFVGSIATVCTPKRASAVGYCSSQRPRLTAPALNFFVDRSLAASLPCTAVKDRWGICTIPSQTGTELPAMTLIKPLETIGNGVWKKAKDTSPDDAT